MGSKEVAEAATSLVRGDRLGLMPRHLGIHVTAILAELVRLEAENAELRAENAGLRARRATPT